jgi:8-oxo-dGTP pyrophosphatase MutT (NUDIX family)
VPERADERLSVYDDEARQVGAMGRGEAKRSGLAVGAINVLLVNARGEALLQKRREDKENGGRWDKTVGGHVGAGEDFDAAAVREAGEELFSDPASHQVRLAPDVEAFGRLVTGTDLRRAVVFRRASLQLNLRDVRRGVDGAVRNVVYHVATYLGRTDVAVGAFRPQLDELAGLRYAPASEVDEMLLRGSLAPNMAFLWLTHARALLALAANTGATGT